MRNKIACFEPRYVRLASLWSAFILAAAATVGAQVAPVAQPTPVGPTGASVKETRNILAENYRIGIGDVIDVVVSKNEALSKAGVRVNNQGGVQLPMLDEDLPAACLTERELADRIREKYKKFLLEPYVNVTVKEFNASPVALLGAVNMPGRFQLQRPVRLLELFTFVNGTKSSAGETVEVFRSRTRPFCDGPSLVIPSGAEEDELISLSLKEAMKGNTQANLLIRAGDIIRVEEAALEQAYLIGNVKAAMTIPLKEPVTLTQAIAMAGGLSSGAQTEKIKVQRRVAGSLTPTEIIVNLKEIKERKREDFLLAANDIIEVPGPSGLKKTWNDIIKTIVPTVTNAPLQIIRPF